MNSLSSHTIFLQTFGCSLNHSDSELMAGLLQEAGYTIVQDPKNAELLVINSCSVKNEAEAKLFRTIKNNPNKKIIVTGCVPQAQPSYIKDKLANFSVIGTNNLNDIIRAVQQTIKGELFQSLKPIKGPRLNLPKLRKNPLIEIIPINKGCLDNCTYCKTKQARGHLQSYSIQDIKQQMQHALDDGCKEIWLTSQDTGCYGLDINSSIVELLKELLNLRGDFRIRLGMMNPNYALQYLDELKAIYQHPKLFKFLHIPIQSGDDRILRIMQRRYKSSAYRYVVSELRKAIPLLTISTDIIVAFPTETDDEFMETYNVVKETKPDVLNVSRYWMRSNTPAALMKQHTGKVSTERSKKVSSLFQKQVAQKNAEWIGWRGEVIIDEYHESGSIIGRNDYYKQIVFNGVSLKLGQKLKVKIVSSGRYDLIPEIL